MTPKCPNTIEEIDLFLEDKHILTPNRNSQESHLASENNLFFSSCSLFAPEYSTSIHSSHKLRYFNLWQIMDNQLWQQPEIATTWLSMG